MLERLKYLRKQLGYNQKDFAKYLGIKQTSYSMIENGKNPLLPRHIKTICSAFKVSENWLIKGEGDMFLNSTYEKELSDIFSNLEPATQDYLIKMAKELLITQNKLLNAKSDDELTTNEKLDLVKQELEDEEHSNKRAKSSASIIGNGTNGTK